MYLSALPSIHAENQDISIYTQRLCACKIIEENYLFGQNKQVTNTGKSSFVWITKRYMFKAGAGGVPEFETRSPLTFYGFPQHVTHQSFPICKLEVVSLK